MTTTTYKVEGMTCGHCVNAVTQELMSLDGVDKVDIDLATGSVTVGSDTALEVERVKAAVDEAGYELIS